MTAARLSDFDFDYPEELIADRPAEPRDSARLMVIGRAGGQCRHAVFKDLPSFLSPGDCLVINETKVLRARLLGRKSTGGRAEVLVTRPAGGGLWAVLASGLKAGQRLQFDGGAATVEGLSEEGEYLCRFDGEVPALLEKSGLAPLPPYILKKRREAGANGDLERYQTVYARESGSIAAPTAGLHFTPAVFDALSAKGVQVAKLTLHVGRGTFRPITAEDPALHKMLAESYSLSEAEAAKIRAAKRVIAVGTTSTRTLESLARRPEGFGAGSGSTDLYIHPGHEFRLVGGLITNFHLPRSTPLMLASAFVGRERLLAAYREAFALRYRLYSYGDAMLIL